MREEILLKRWLNLFGKFVFMTRLFSTFFVLFLTVGTAFAQSKDSTEVDYTQDLIQFSGVTVDGEDLTPIRFASVMISKTYRGTISDNSGYFSFVASVGDTIHFSSVGYKDAAFVIPDTLTTTRYSLIQVLERDTILLAEQRVYPWPSKEQFKEAFLSLNDPENEFERAKRNLALAEQRDANLNLPRRSYGSLAYKYQMQQYQSRLYYAGQYPANNLLNPIAWAQFIQSWKNSSR